MEARDKAINLGGAYNNAVTILTAGDEFGELDFDESADVVKELADAIFERREASFKEFKIGDTGGGSGNSRGGSKSSRSSSKKRSGSSPRRGSSSKKKSRGSNGPSSKQIEFYGDLMEILEDNDVNVSDYDNTAESLSFEEAKAAIGELIELRDEADLG